MREKTFKTTQITQPKHKTKPTTCKNQHECAYYFAQLW